MKVVEQNAESIVQEMADLGAQFTISSDGERWTWSPKPEEMREPIRRFWTSVADRNALGFDKAMISAIRRLGASGP